MQFYPRGRNALTGGDPCFMRGPEEWTFRVLGADYAWGRVESSHALMARAAAEWL